MKKIALLGLIASLLFVVSCHNDNSDNQSDMSSKYQQFDKKSHQPNSQEAGEKWNSVNASREDEDIDFFTERYGWKTERKGNGLRIEVLKAGNGSPIVSEDVVTLEYTTCLLTGDTVYTSKEMGPKTFAIDKSNEIAGLNEAVKSLRKGAKAHVVIPSFLGYGVAGDGQRIRGKVSLAMTIEVVEVEKNN